MTTDLKMLALWRDALVSSVRSDSPDLSARQMALVLTVYLSNRQHTVRGLAADLNISKPAISRALDRLGELGFIRRQRDEEDRRNVIVQRTVKGSVYLSDFAQWIATAQTSQKTDNFSALHNFLEEETLEDGADDASASQAA